MALYEVYADVMYTHKYIVDAVTENIALERVKEGEVEPEEISPVTAPVLTQVRKVKELK